MSDDLLMEAVPQNLSPWILSLEKALMAGVDLLLICRDLDRTLFAVDQLASRMKEDLALRQRVYQAGERVEAFRGKL